MHINYINAQVFFFFLIFVFSSTQFDTNIWQTKRAERKGQSKIYMNNMHHLKGNSL